MKIKRTHEKESDSERKERIALSGAMKEQVIPDKKNKKNPKHKENPLDIINEATMKKEKFEKFLESLKGKGQNNLIESVKQGFQVCFENYIPDDHFDQDDGYGSNQFARDHEMERQVWQHDREPDDSEQISQAVAQGKYVVVGNYPVYSDRDAVMGYNKGIVSIHDSYEDANTALMNHYNKIGGSGDEEYYEILSKPKEKEKPKETPREYDLTDNNSLPF